MSRIFSNIKKGRTKKSREERKNGEEKGKVEKEDTNGPSALNIGIGVEEMKPADQHNTQAFRTPASTVKLGGSQNDGHQEASAVPLSSGQTQPSCAGAEIPQPPMSSIPTEGQVLRLIAVSYLQGTNPRSRDDFDHFLQYMEKMQLVITNVSLGSLLITVKCDSLQILERLWENYLSGHLGQVVQRCFVTEEILTELSLEELKLKTTISEEEYKACKKYLGKDPAIEAGETDDGDDLASNDEVIMAEARGSVYQTVLSIVESFLVNINELTEENKGRLSKLDELAKIMASIKNEKGDVEGTPGAQKCIALIGELFGSYTELISRLSDIHSMTNEMENKQREDKSFVLPQAMQAKIDAVKQYLEKAKSQLEESDNTLSDLVNKVRMASDEEFQISDNEIKKLKMDAEDVDSALRACKTYLDQAENEIKMLELDIQEEMNRFGIKTAAVGAGVMIGGAILLQSEILKGTVSEVAAKLGGLLGFGSSLAGGAISLGLCLAAIIDNHRKLLTSHVEVLKTELRKVKTDYEVTKVMNAEKVTERMAGRD